MAQIIELTDRSGLDYLHGLVERAGNMQPVLKEIGADMQESAIQRFSTTTAPNGTPWARNSAVTLLNYSQRFARNKNGTLKPDGVRAMGAKKPGTVEGTLANHSINFQVKSECEVSIGSSMPYAGTFHYGAKSGEYGFGFYATREGSFPLPWGDIPARPFLGASEDDKANIVRLVQGYLLEE